MFCSCHWDKNFPSKIILVNLLLFSFRSDMSSCILNYSKDEAFARGLRSPAVSPVGWLEYIVLFQRREEEEFSK